MKGMGTRYKRCENKALRLQPQNIRIKKSVRPVRAEAIANANLLSCIKVEGKELSVPSNVVISEKKEKREDKGIKRADTEEVTRPSKSIVETAADSSITQSNDACPKQAKDTRVLLEKGNCRAQDEIETQIQKKQQQRLYMEQLQEQIRENEFCNASSSSANSHHHNNANKSATKIDKSFGICGSGIYKTDKSPNEALVRSQKRIPSETENTKDATRIQTLPSQDASHSRSQEHSALPSITGSHRRHVQYRFDVFFRSVF